MQTYYITFLLLLLLSLVGCRPTTESKRQAELAQFHKAMQQIDASVPLGMARSNVIAMLGTPVYTSTNCGPNSNWLADDYSYEPHVLGYNLITNGFTFVYSNDTVIQKHPIMGEQP